MCAWREGDEGVKLRQGVRLGRLSCRMLVRGRVIRLREQRVECLSGPGEAHSLDDARARAIELYAGDVTEPGTGERVRVVWFNRELKLGIAAESQFDCALSAPSGPTGDHIIKHAQACDGTRTASVQYVHGVGENCRVRIPGNQ